MGWDTSLDWETSGGLIGEPTQPAILDLAKATDERAGWGVGLEAIAVPGASRRVLWQIANALGTMCTDYVDQTENGGDFEGYGYLPTWTTTKVKAEIGEVPVETDPAASFNPKPGTPVTSDLIQWYYKAIKLLIWVTQDELVGRFGGSSDYGTVESRQAGSGTAPVTPTYAGTAAKWTNDTSWAAQGPTGYPKNQCFTSVGGIESTNWLLSKIRGTRILDHPIYNFDIDWYEVLEKIDTPSSFFLPNELSAYTSTEHEMFKYHTSSGAGPHEDIIIMTDDPPENNVPSLETPELAGFNQELLIQICKLDVTGGFDYQ